MRGPASVAACVALVSASMIACSALVGLDGFAGDPPTDAGLDDERASDASGPAPDALEDTSAIDDALPCARFDAGPRMIDVGDFCIDATEVTQADYAAYLAATKSQPGPQPPECAWNTKITPLEPATPGSRLPVVGIDWCDARLYCAWAGKRLCGARGGGTLTGDETDLQNATKDEWYAACSNEGDGQHRYPYGNDYVREACAGEDAGVPSPVGSHPQCEGGVPGLVDMSGNAWEWQNACAKGDGGPGSDLCLLRGGSAASSPANLQCRGRLPYRRAGSFGEVGVRCCADR